MLLQPPNKGANKWRHWLRKPNWPAARPAARPLERARCALGVPSGGGGSRANFARQAPRRILIRASLNNNHAGPLDDVRAGPAPSRNGRPCVCWLEYLNVVVRLCVSVRPAASSYMLTISLRALSSFAKFTVVVVGLSGCWPRRPLERLTSQAKVLRPGRMRIRTLLAGRRLS
jgi:hypothetical protein